MYYQFRKGLFNAMNQDEARSVFCLDLDKTPIEPNMMRDNLFPTTAMFNAKYWNKNYMKEMDKYGIFDENKVTKKGFHVNPNFCVVVLSTADTEAEVFANVGFIPSIEKFHKVIL
jgi:hypothetical protein